MPKEVRIPVTMLKSFMKDVFIQAGVPDEDAQICSDVLIASDLRGIESHGINRLKSIYIDRIRDGILNPKTQFEILKETPTTAVIDGHNGMGMVIAKKAMDLTIQKALQYGMGMTAVRNSSHYGIAGYYAMMASEKNCIGITGTNARPSVAPTFGVENMLGTNPLTFAIPTDEDFPFVLDCATCITQRGKIEVYEKLGKEMPPGWVISETGQTMTHPTEVLDALVKGSAALTPLGGIGEETAGYKGYGYTTVVEILSAALQNGSFLQALSGMQNGKKVPYRLGHFFIAINIEAFTEMDQFKATTGSILRALRNSKKAPGQDRIYTAGEKEAEAHKIVQSSGVAVNEELQKEIKTLCERFKLSHYNFPF